MKPMPPCDPSHGIPSEKTNPGIERSGAGPATGWIQDHFKSWDGAKLFYRFYPAPKSRHTVIMLHGYGEHSGRYVKFPERMGRVSAQFAVMDHRGMGQSDGPRGDIDVFDAYLKDVTAFIEHLRRKYAIPQKFILLGHSMGGLVATCWAMKNPETIKLLILSSPFFGLRYSEIIIPLNRLLRFFIPNLVYKNPIRSRSLSHDPEEIAAYRKDPLILHHISARLLDELLKRMENLRRQQILSVMFPVYLLAAGEERIVDPKVTRLFFDRLVSPRKERTFFDSFFHEIFSESHQQEAFNVLKTIIEDCV